MSGGSYSTLIQNEAAVGSTRQLALVAVKNGIALVFVRDWRRKAGAGECRLLSAGLFSSLHVAPRTRAQVLPLSSL